MVLALLMPQIETPPAASSERRAILAPVPARERGALKGLRKEDGFAVAILATPPKTKRSPSGLKSVYLRDADGGWRTVATFAQPYTGCGQHLAWDLRPLRDLGFSPALVGESVGSHGWTYATIGTVAGVRFARIQDETLLDGAATGARVLVPGVRDPMRRGLEVVRPVLILPTPLRNGAERT